MNNGKPIRIIKPEKISGGEVQFAVAELRAWSDLEFRAIPDDEDPLDRPEGAAKRRRLWGIMPGAGGYGKEKRIVPGWPWSIDLAMIDLVPIAGRDGNRSSLFIEAMKSIMNLGGVPGASPWPTWAHAIEGAARPLILCLAYIEMERSIRGEDLRIASP